VIKNADFSFPWTGNSWTFEPAVKNPKTFFFAGSWNSKKPNNLIF